MKPDMLRQLVALDKLIHEPARLAILSVLAQVDQADFLFIRKQTGLTKGNLSAHLSKLEAGQYIAIEKTYLGKKPLTVCRITEAGRSAYDSYCETLRDFLTRLD